MLALATYELTKDYAVGFWRKRPYRALDRLTLEVERRRGLRLPRAERRRQDDHAEAADAAGVPDLRPRGDPRPAGRRSRRSSAGIGYLPENPYFYDYLTAEELLVVLRRPVRLPRRRSAARARRRLLDEVGIGAERRLQLRKFSKGMLQRVGIAQALINDPELVIFDEPMSGLDPLGRRDVRALILRLRDRGCTVFFSSHVLSDAEALCSRVAILAKGRLMTSGRLTDMLAFQAHGWELVVGRRRPSRCAGSSATRARRDRRSISEGRYTLELPLDPPPDRFVAELAAAGAALVSLNPMRETLEDFFVEQVTRPTCDARLGERRSAREGDRRWIAVNVFRESVRDKVLYNLVLFAVAADRRVVPASASSPPGRTSRSSRTSGWRRPRCSGCSSPSSSASGWSRRKSSGAASTACWPSRSTATSSSLGKYAGLVLTLAVNLAIMAVGAVRRAGLHGVECRRRVVAQRGRRRRSIRRMLKAVGLILRRAGARHGDRAVLLDLLDADPVGGVHLRPVHRRPVQRRPAELQAGRRLAGRRRGSRAALYWVLPNLAPFDVKAQVVHGQPVPAGYMALTSATGCLHRRAARRRGR